MQQHFFGWPLAVAGSWFIAPANAIFVRTSAVERNHNFQNFANSLVLRARDFAGISRLSISPASRRVLFDAELAAPRAAYFEAKRVAFLRFSVLRSCRTRGEH